MGSARRSIRVEVAGHHDLSVRPEGCREVLPLIDVAVEQLMAQPDRPDVDCILQRWNSLETSKTAGSGERRMQFMNRLGQFIASASERFYQPLAEV